MPPTRPPRFTEALLNWLVQDDLQTPLGDFEEYFHELEQARGAAYARRWYRRQVLQLVPGRLVANIYWSIAMLKNYLLLAYRNLLKKPLVSGINLFGLSLAIACTVVVYVFIMSHTTNERVHVNGESIFLVKSIFKENGEQQISAETPAPLGPALAGASPQVEDFARMRIWYAQVDAGGEEPFGELITLVDPAFLDLFTFTIRSGEARSFGDPAGVLISQKAARKFFGEEDPIGRPLGLTINGGEPTTVFVRGVVDDIRSSLAFTILIPYETFIQDDEDTAGDWSRRAFTFVQVSDPAAVDALTPQLERYVAPQQSAVLDHPVQGYFLDNLYDLNQHADDVGDNFVHTIPWAPVVALSLVALFLLALSCVNYINISLSTAGRRIKEIGMRKVVGGSRRQLVRQFLTENILLCATSLVIGVAIAHFLLIPAFNSIAEGEDTLLTLPVADLLLFLGGLMLTIALVSGAYPAFYMASFRPTAIFQGTVRMGRKNRFMQGLLAFQFILAFTMMIVCVGLLLNARDEHKRDWGYNKENVVFVDLGDSQRFAVMRDYVASLPQIVSIAGSQDHVSRGEPSVNYSVEGEIKEAWQFRVGAGYGETLGLRLRSGRFFDSERERQAEHTLVVNETFTHVRGWDTPVGRTVRIDSVTYDIIGEVADFHIRGFMAVIRPTVLRLAEPDTYSFLTVRVEDGAGRAVATALRERAASLWNDHAVTVEYQDQVFDRYFAETRGITHVFLFTAFLALALSCMGLFGLAAQNTLSRMKEIGVRKVLGATLSQLSVHMHRRFAILLVAAGVLASPLGYLLLDALLGSIYTYHIAVGPATFIIAYALVFITGLMTLSTQVYQMAVTDPATTLRNA